MKKRDEWLSSQALRAAKLCDDSWVAGLGLALSLMQGVYRCSKAK